MRPSLRTLGLLSALTATCAAPIFASASASAPAEPVQTQALTQLVERFAIAQQTFDVATLAELTTEDYVEVSTLGEVDPRDKMLDLYAPEHKGDAPAMSIQETQVRVFGETGVVLARLTYIMKGMDNQVHSLQLRGTFVARKAPSGWKLVSSSFTPVNVPKAR